LLPFASSSISAFAHNFRIPEVHQVSTSVEHEAANRVIAEVSYSFVHGQNLIRARDMNLPPPTNVQYPVFDSSGVNLLGYGSVETFSTWQFSTTGLPTNFGFAAAIHPRDTKTAYCIPLDGMKRTATPFGIGVYRTTDKGKSWDRLDKGLPEGAPMESVREGMHNDRLDPMGLYFGTANGDVWASKNEGESWSRIAQYLPYVTSVHAATIE